MLEAGLGALKLLLVLLLVVVVELAVYIAYINLSTTSNPFETFQISAIFGKTRYATATPPGRSRISNEKEDNEGKKYKFYNLAVEEEGIEEKLHGVLRNITEKKTIVFWYKPFGVEEGTKELNRDCGYCDVTYDQRKFDTADAVVFHFNELKKSTLPTKRKANQYYVFFAMESPPALLLRNMYFKEYNNFFNLTRSYRRDADIFHPYGKMEEIAEELQEKYKNTGDAGIEETMKAKKKLGIWIVSNCGATSGAVRRMQINNEIAKTKIGQRIDRKGRCFPHAEKLPDISLKLIIREYKFYFSMENGYHCRDYITEKLYSNAYKSEAVPVVWGARKSDYHVPEHSTIFVEDFESIADLADYLDYLDRNDSAYREYFQWRRKDAEQMRNYGRKYSDCQLCRLLHGINVDNLYYEDYEEKRKDIPLFGYPSSDKSRIVGSLYDWIYKTEWKGCLPNS